MRLVYTAGPITADYPSDRFKNCLSAWEHSLEIWKRGHGVICPQFNTLFMDSKTIPYGTFMDADYQMIVRACDAMLMLPGWTDSKGACHERDVAFAHNIPVFYYDGLEKFWDFLESSEVDTPSKQVELEVDLAAH